jgi:hypothetical protein
LQPIVFHAAGQQHSKRSQAAEVGHNTRTCWVMTSLTSKCIYHRNTMNQSLYFVAQKPINECTVRWSNFDRWDPKMGVLKYRGNTPCGHHLKWKLTPETPLWTPCSWPPRLWFSREKLLNIFKVL